MAANLLFKVILHETTVKSNLFITQTFLHEKSIWHSTLLLLKLIYDPLKNFNTTGKTLQNRNRGTGTNLRLIYVHR